VKREDAALILITGISIGIAIATTFLFPEDRYRFLFPEERYDSPGTAGEGHQRGIDLASLREPRRNASEPLLTLGSQDGSSAVPGDLIPQAENGGTTRSPHRVGAVPVSRLGGLEESFLPTPEGLYGRTVEMWSQPEFSILSEKEMRALLPVEEGMMVGTFPGTIQDLFGDFPTLEECRKELEARPARLFLQRLCYWDDIVSEMQAIPSSRRTDEYARKYEEAVAMRDSSEDSLMQELDKGSGWHGWYVVSRLYREWAK
jgi:hypothetical protein